MKDILHDIIAYKHIEVESAKKKLSLDQLQNQKRIGDKPRSMSQSILCEAPGIIAEFKRKSPSKGWINQSANPSEISMEYQRAGAAAVSVLTDEKFFGGGIEDLKAIRSSISLPILRKDFIIDEYQIVEAYNSGADAVLLIAAALDHSQCEKLANKAHELGLEILLEIHHEAELDYITQDIDMIGVNNRNLGTFVTDVSNSLSLINHLPTGKVRISESGISNPSTVKMLQDRGFNGFLIGENFMKHPNPGQVLSTFIDKLGL